MFRPMLACDADLTKLTYPLAVSPKLDGIRAVVRDGQLLSRTLKPIPNRAIRTALSRPELNGLDGELVVGPPHAADVYRRTVMGVMAEDVEVSWTYYVFDRHDLALPWSERYARLHDVRADNVVPLAHTHVESLDDLLEYEQLMLRQGFEGVMLRALMSPYKHGRSTVREGYLLKLKRFADSEAEVLDVIEEMHNANEPTVSALGLTKRSSHKANKVGKGRMGALRVRDVHSGVEFELGTGFSDDDKRFWWTWRHNHEGRTRPLVKYKYLPVGVKDRPRHPVYLGIRSLEDLA